MDNSDSDAGAVTRTDPGKIVSLTRFATGQSLSPIRQAEAYWSALRSGGSIPRRSDVDPRGLENLLHCSFILESVAPGVARFRLAGRAISEVTGMEVRGMPVTALFTPASRSAVAAALREMFEGPGIAELSMSSQARFSRRRYQAHMVLLPLKDDFDRTTRALGVLVAEDGREPVPARFDVTGKTVRPVAGLHYGDHEQNRKAPAFDGGMAETGATFAPGVPYLRLVKNGD